MDVVNSDTHETNGWWGRNWKWVVPTGCLGVFGMCLLGIALTFFGITSTIRSTEAYSQGVARARGNPAVLAALGEPIEEGMFPSGSVNTSGPNGHASLAIKLSGPNGEGTLFVEADKSMGVWSFSNIVFEAPSGERIDLH